MKSRVLALVAAFALLATALTFAPVVSAHSHEPACTTTPSVTLYSQDHQNTGGGVEAWAEEIRLCYGVYPSSGFSQLKNVTFASDERCEGFLAINNGNFNDCLSSGSVNMYGWSNGKTLCLYNAPFYSKSEGWSYISAYRSPFDFDGSLDDKLSSLKWVTGGSGNC